MDRTELNAKWETYCQNFLGNKPEGYSTDGIVFDAQKKDFESGVKKISADDWLETLSFHEESAMSLLGTMECNREDIRECLNFLKQGPVKMAFNYEVGKDDPFHTIKDESCLADRDVWFIGDIHGDILAFQSAKAFIDSNSRRKPIYVLLGDIFDRNDFSLNVVLAVLKLLKDWPDSVFMIAGNHDDGLAWDENSRRFSSTITPQQYTEYLNTVDDDLISALMAEFIKVLKTLPVGLVLPNGLLVTHGGIPSRPDRNVKNIWEGLEPQEIKKKIAEKRQDFQRNRFMGEVSSGSKLHPDFSWVELINFSHAVESAYGVVIRALLRGHDHCDLYRHEWAKSSFKGNENCSDFERVQDVLTMTSMTLMESGEERISGFLKREVACPSVARYSGSTLLPQVYSLEFTAEEVKKYCGEVRKHLGKESLEYVDKHLARLQGDLEDAEEDLKENSEKLNAQKPVYEEQKKIVENANSQTIELENVVKNITTELEKIDNDIARLKSEKNITIENREELLKRIRDGEEFLQEKKEKIDEFNNALGQKEKKENLLKKALAYFGLSDSKKKYTQGELQKLQKKVQSDIFHLQSTLQADEKKADGLSEKLKLIELNLDEQVNLGKSLNQQKSEKESKLGEMKKYLSKETQMLNDLQNEITPCERRIKQASDEIAEINRDMELCNTKKELFTGWISA